MGRRAGTESMVLLSGFGKAAELLAGEGYALREHMREMRDRLQSHLEASIPKVHDAFPACHDPAMILMLSDLSWTHFLVPFRTVCG